MIGRELGQYRVVGKLGEGGMGVVYKAHDSRLHRHAAIKVLPPDLVADADRRQRFTQEARTASALNHPGIVTIYDISEADGVDFIAMELVEGKTLSELIGRKGLSLRDTLTYAAQAATALAKAHAAGLVHRDLKPSNIMVTTDGLVKILDFGVAKLVATDEGEPDSADTETRTVGNQLQTAAGTVVGTVAYMSPEQAQGLKVDARSDIFSFGAVLYEMVTGARAFQATTSALTLSAVVASEPTPPSEISKELPRDLERIILRCLRKDPARRFQHMEDLAVELEEVKTESGTRVATSAKPPRTRRYVWLGAAAAVILALAAAGLWWMSARPPVTAGSPTLVPLTSFPGDEWLPTFSPDGSQVAFSWTGGDTGTVNHLYVMPVGAPTAIQLTTGPNQDISAAWSPDGKFIAFARMEGAQATIHVLTPPIPNSERRIATIPNNSAQPPTLSWFPDGSAVVTAEFDSKAGMNGIVVISIQTGQVRRLLWTPLPEAGGYGHFYPMVAPDGRAIAHVRCAGSGSFDCDLYLSKLDQNLNLAGDPERLTNQHARPWSLAWMPDGRSIIYASGGMATSTLWRVPLSGGDPEQLGLAGDHAVGPAVSARGDLVAFGRLGNDFDIWRFSPTGSLDRFASSNLDERNPQLSPDGKLIVFESRRLGAEQLWLANADGSNPRPLTQGSQFVQGSPRWSPDSKFVVFDSRDEGPVNVYVVNAAGGAKRRVAEGSTPSWSRNGKWIYFQGKGQIWRVPSEGGQPSVVTDKGGTNAVESDDGTLVYYRRQRALYARPAAGGDEREVVNDIVVGSGQFVSVSDGLYYVARPESSPPVYRELRFVRTGSSTPDVLYRFQVRSGAGLTVSPDRKTFLYSGLPVGAGDDLMLIRNFR